MLNKIRHGVPVFITASGELLYLSLDLARSVKATKPPDRISIISSFGRQKIVTAADQGSIATLMHRVFGIRDTLAITLLQKNNSYSTV